MAVSSSNNTNRPDRQREIQRAQQAQKAQEQQQQNEVQQQEQQQQDVQDPVRADPRKVRDARVQQLKMEAQQRARASFAHPTAQGVDHNPFLNGGAPGGFNDPNGGPNGGFNDPNAGFNPNGGFNDPNGGFNDPNAGFNGGFDPNAGRGPGGVRRGLGGPQGPGPGGPPGAGGRDPTPFERQQINAGTEQAYQQLFGAQRMVKSALKSGDPQAIGEAYQALESAYQNAAFHQEQVSQAFGPKSSIAQHAGDPMRHAERDLEINQSLRHYADLHSSDPHTREQATLDLARMAATNPGDIESQNRHAQAVKLWNKAKAEQQFSDDPALNRAIEQAQSEEAQNADTAKAAYDKALFSDDPAERQQALDTLKETGRLSRSRQIEEAEMQVALKDLTDGHLSPEQFQDRLKKLSAGGNERAEQVLDQLGHDYKERLADPEQLKQLKDYNDADIDRSRTDLLLEDLSSASSPGELRQAETRLKAQAGEGNEAAGEAAPRVSAQRALAELRDAKTPEARKQAAEDLAKQAEGGSDLARLALSAGLVSTQGSGVQSAFGGGGYGDGVVMEGTSVPGRGPSGAAGEGRGTGGVGGAGDGPSVDGPEPGPVKLDRLGGSIGLPKLPPEATRALQLQAAKQLGKDPTNISRGEALALAAASAKASSEGDSELAKASREALDGAIAAGNRDALRGVGAAIDANPPGAESLVDTFTKGAALPGYERELRGLSPAATTGNKAAIGVHAHAASSENVRLQREGERTLVDASAAGQTEKVTDALLAVPEGERGPGFHRTLGRQAAEGELDAKRDSDVRGALRQGLASGADKPQHASAADGMAAIADRWQSEDVKAIADNLSPEVTESLVDAADKLGDERATELTAALRGKLKSGTDDEAGLAAKALGSLGKHATPEDVKAITDRLATSGDKRGLEGLINMLSRTDDPRVGNAATRAIMDRQWKGLDRLDASAKQKLVDYVKGSGDPDLQTEISDLVYDAGIRPPVAGLLRKWGVEGTGEELKNKALAAKSHYGDEAVRRLKANVDLYNALPADLRATLLGKSEPTKQELEQLGQNIDLDRAVDLAADGKLHTSRHAFLTGDLRGQLRDLSVAQRKELAQLNQTQKSLGTERGQALQALTSMTEKGVGFGDRVGHALSVANPIGWFAGRDKTTIERYDERQSQGVDALQAADRKLNENADKIATASRRQLYLDAALDTGDSARYRAEGRSRAADNTALDAWREHGEMLGELSPGLHNELFKRGDTPQTEGSWQRLHRNGVVGTERPPELSGNADERYKKAGDALKSLQDTKAERTAVRNHALFMLDQDPNVQELTAAGAKLAQGLPTVQKMLTSGMKGTKYQDYVDDLRSRAGPLKDTLDHLKANPKIVDGAKKRLTELKSLESDLQAQVKAGDGDPTALREVQDRIKGIQGMVDLVENDGLRNTLETVLDKSKTGADTFGNWLANEGPKIGAAIAVGVAAAVTIVASGGAAAPLWAVALAGAAGGMVGYEAAAEGMHFLRNNLDPDVTSGRLSYGDRSRAGSYFAGEDKFDPKTGKFREQTFFGDVAGPYAQQLATDFAFTYATMGAGRLLAGGINRVGAQFLTKNAEAIRRVSGNIAQIEKQLGKEAAKRTFREIGKEIMREFPKEVMDELKDTALETALQQGLQRIDKRLAAVAGVVVAAGKGVNIRAAADGNIQYNGKSEAELRGLLEADGMDLRPVSGKPGHYDVLLDGGDKLSLSPMDGTLNDGATRRPDGSVAPRPVNADLPTEMDNDPKILSQRADARRQLADRIEADLDPNDVSTDAAFKRQEVMDLRGEATSLERRAQQLDPTRKTTGPQSRTDVETRTDGADSDQLTTPTVEEQARAKALVNGLPLADQHAHEIGSTPDHRVGAHVEGIEGADPAAQQRFIGGLESEIASGTKGGKTFTVNGLSEGPGGALRAEAKVISSPRSQDAARQSVDNARAAVSRLLSPRSAEQKTALQQEAQTRLAAARNEVAKLPEGERQGFVEALDAAEQQLQNDPDAAARSLRPFGQGALNRMSDAAKVLTDPDATQAQKDRAAIRMQSGVLDLRNAARLTKPDSDTWNQLDGNINGGKEFFTRYKSVLGTHGGQMDGSGIAEVARERRSAMAGELGYQEIRADLDTDRHEKAFGEGNQDALLSMDQLAERSRTFADNTRQTDAHMVYALTKRETTPADKADTDEATREAPAYAKQADNFVDAYFEKGPDGNLTQRAKDLQSGIAGIDHGGRESVERAPMLFATAHGKRNVHNALELQGGVAEARAADVDGRAVEGGAKIDDLIKAELEGNPELLAKWEKLNRGQLDPSSWKVGPDGAKLDPTDPEYQQKLSEAAKKAPGDWSIDVGDMSIEDIARVNRAVHSALRTHASQRGTSADVNLLGATNHSGEQLQSVAPDVLLDQVDQSLAMGVDRIGHGVILGTPMSSVYTPGPNGKMWPKNLPDSKRTDNNSHMAKTKAEVEQLEQRRQDLIQRAKDGNVVIEVNMTSNLVINDQATADHAIHEFHKHGKDGLRFSVNTDDETILDTSTRGEYQKVQEAAELDATETARVMLEGYDSRLGGKTLEQRQQLIDTYNDHMQKNLLTGDDAADTARVQRLAKHFGVPYSEALSPGQNLQAVIAKVMS